MFLKSTLIKFCLSYLLKKNNLWSPGLKLAKEQHVIFHFSLKTGIYLLLLKLFKIALKAYILLRAQSRAHNVWFTFFYSWIFHSLNFCSTETTPFLLQFNIRKFYLVIFCFIVLSTSIKSSLITKSRAKRVFHRFSNCFVEKCVTYPTPEYVDTTIDRKICSSIYI